MVSDESLEEQRTRLLNAMRVAFAAGNYSAVLECFEALGEPTTIRSGIRVEAIVLASRAHIAMGDRKAGRQLLRHVWNTSLKTHRLYRYVAVACLELGDYRRAIPLITKAAELAEAAPAQAPGDDASDTAEPSS